MSSNEQTIKMLRGIEWSRGNGQCDMCGNEGPRMLLNSSHPNFACVGHDKKCLLASSLVENGEKVIYKGDYTPEMFQEFSKNSEIREKESILVRLEQDIKTVRKRLLELKSD